jgi:hypothetical protein
VVSHGRRVRRDVPTRAAAGQGCRLLSSCLARQVISGIIRGVCAGQPDPERRSAAHTFKPEVSEREAQVDTIQFYDSNCQVGRYNHRIEGAPYSTAEAVQDAASLGIARRLVYHAMAKEHSPVIGNRRLVEAVGGTQTLTPCWAVSTWVTGEMAAPADLISELRQAGVRAVRFFRHSYHIPMAEWSLGPLWTALERHRVPVLLDVGDRWATMDGFDANEVHALCSSHPELPVVLIKHRIRYNRQVYQLMEACPNLRLELSGYWHYRAVEEICGRFGACRLLFGTNWPYMDSSFAIAAVMYADVSRDTKVAVAGENLSALLEGIQW